MMQPGNGFVRGRVAAFGYDVPFAEAGSGTTLVSLPGSAGLEMSVAKDLLSHEMRVIEFDPPGWGETEPLAARMRQRDLAAVLARAVDELGVDTFHLVGTSMGGTNAFWLAQQMPDRVLGVVLEGPMLFVRPEDLVRPESESMVQAVRDGLAYDDTAYPAPPAHPLKPWQTPEFFHEQMRRRFRMMRHTDYPGDDADLRTFAAATGMPVTMLLGTEDEILKPSYANRFREVVADAHVVIVDGATHDIQNTAPDAFVEAVRRQVDA